MTLYAIYKDDMDRLKPQQKADPFFKPWQSVNLDNKYGTTTA